MHRQDITKDFCRCGAELANTIWFPFLMDMLISEPFIIPPSINQLELPSNMKETHPLWWRPELMGCMVSGKGMLT